MMTRWILLGVAVAALYVCLGDGLICYECDAFCSVTRQPVTCKPGEQCGIRTRYKGSIVSTTSGLCMNNTICNTESNDTALTVVYHIKNTCCNKDLCNTGTSARLSLLSGLAAVGLLWLCT